LLEEKKSFHVSNEFVRHTQLQLRSNLSSTKESLHSSTFVGLIDADKEMLAKPGEAWDIKHFTAAINANASVTSIDSYIFRQE
jgi:hypothetical protein